MPATPFPRLLLGLYGIVAAGFAQEPAPAPRPALTQAVPETTGELPAASADLAKKAAAAFNARDWKAARAAYQELLKADSGNALIWANLGAVEQQAGLVREAIASFEKSVALNPRLAQSWSALGLLYAAEGDAYRAVSSFTRAIHEEPGDARAHNYLAIAAKNMGWIDAAQAELLRAIELNPEYGIAHFNLALLYLDQKPPAVELAKRHYDKARTLGVEKDEIVERRLKE